MKQEVHTFGFFSLLLCSLGCNGTLVEVYEETGFPQMEKERISNSFFTSAAYERMTTVSKKSTCAMVSVVS